MSKSKSTLTREERREQRAAKAAYLRELCERPEASDPGIQRIAFERFGAGYSVKNQILIIMQRPDATKVAGFHAWKGLGRKVKKGAKGIAILVPCTRAQSADDGAEEGEQSTKAPRMRFVTGYVFDISDTEPLSCPCCTSDSAADWVGCECSCHD